MSSGDQTARTRELGLDAGLETLLLHRCAVRVVAGPDKGRSFTVETPTVRVGSSGACEVRLSDRSVSRCHAIVSLRDGRCIVRDEGSTNGTYVDGVRVIEAYVSPTSIVRIGETQLELRSDQRLVEIPEGDGGGFDALVPRSRAMRRLVSVLDRVAPTALTCVLLGETGTGKEVIARAIHDASPRRAAPFVVVDCASLHPNLVESELFGHERGAFTGAEREHAGAFERAHGGTVFLDEIGELPPALQPKLLRVLERREVQRLGSTVLRDLDVRVLAATHRDLDAMCVAGELRQDLYFRLGEVVLPVPPLRERREDVAELVSVFLRSVRAGATPTIAPDVLRRLELRSWPGNVRELKNWVRRATAFHTHVDMAAVEALEALEPALPDRSTGQAVEVNENVDIHEARARWASVLEREYLARVVRAAGNDMDRVAAHIGLGRKQLLRLLRQHGLRAPADEA